MPIFDDRFARQNRCEPPPEFPLASPYTRIVHLLSGPTLYALTQIRPRTSGSVGDAPKLSPTFTFIPRWGFTPGHSHIRLTPWSVFQDGSLATITPASLQKRVPQPPEGYDTTGYNTPPKGSHIPDAFTPDGKLMLAWAGGMPRGVAPVEPPNPSLVASASLLTISRAV